MKKICRISQIKEGQSFVFSIPNEEKFGIILVKRAKIVYGYLNICPHSMLPLNLNDRNVLSRDKFHLICKNHAALFHPETGTCVSGPCLGKALKKIKLENKNQEIYLISNGSI